MKYGLYLETKARPEWRDKYLDYNGLKTLIDLAVAEDRASGTANAAFSQRVTSLTVSAPNRAQEEGAHERFCGLISQEVSGLPGVGAAKQ
eukprot:scaffold21962_cov30-Prasinocladus_malaysianus.AAC.1